MKKAFTLAETLIVLVIIGILASILLPTIKNITPDRNLMKFKKAHNTLGSAIRELVQSEEYYLNGDLGVKVDGNWVIDTDYFMLTFSNVVNYKKIQLPEKKIGKYDMYSIIGETNVNNNETEKVAMDNVCKTKQSNFNSYLLTNDDIYFYQYDDEIVYGIEYDWLPNQRNPFYSLWNRVVEISYCKSLPTVAEQDQCVLDNFTVGFYYVYSIMCIDIDGIGKGEDPFGYGIRVDGKIMNGKRAEEWLEKE